MAEIVLRATVIADASFCPKTKASGYAFWVASDFGRIRKSGNFKKDPSGSAEAEYWALCNGIQVAINRGAELILAQTDCLTVVNEVNANKGLIRDIRERHPGITIQAKHVKGHTRFADPRFYVNRWCDAEAMIYRNKQRIERKYRK